MSRNNPNDGKIITLDDFTEKDSFSVQGDNYLTEPHIAFAIQEEDIMSIVHHRGFIQRFFYAPLLGYCFKIHPVSGYENQFERAKSVATTVIKENSKRF